MALSIISVVAVDPVTVRVRYSEPVLALSSSGSADALNPANYQIAGPVRSILRARAAPFPASAPTVTVPLANLQRVSGIVTATLGLSAVSFQGTGTSAVTLSGTPTQASDVILAITTGGTVGTSFSLQATVNGNPGPVVAMGTATQYPIPGTGLTATFSAGTTVTADTYTFNEVPGRLIPPGWIVGATVTLSPGEGFLAPGAKVITGVGPNFITYTEAGSNRIAVVQEYLSQEQQYQAIDLVTEQQDYATPTLVVQNVQSANGVDTIGANSTTYQETGPGPAYPSITDLSKDELTIASADLPCPTTPSVEQDFLDMFDRLFPTSFLAPMKTGQGPGYEQYQARGAIGARVSTAIARLACQSFIGSATGGAFATGTVQLFRPTFVVTLVRAAGIVTATFLGGIVPAGFLPGACCLLGGTDANFPAGIKSIASSSIGLTGVPPTITYAEAGANATSSAVETMSMVSSSTNLVSLVRFAGVVTATFAAAAVPAGMVPGGTVYLSPGDINFPAGAKTILAITPTSLSYTEAGAFAATIFPQYLFTPITVNAGTVVQCSASGRQFVTTTQQVFNPSDLGPFTVPAQAVEQAYEYNVGGQAMAADGEVIPGEIDTISSLNTSPPFGDPTILVQQITAMAGGIPPALDQIGADRGIYRNVGESDSAYRVRVKQLPDTVSPAAIRRALLRIFTVLNHGWAFDEPWDPNMCGCFDVPPGTPNVSSALGAFDDVQRYPLRNYGLDEGFYKGAFVLVVENLEAMQDFGMAFDDPGTFPTDFDSPNVDGQRAPPAYDIPITVTTAILQGTQDGFDQLKLAVYQGLDELIQSIKPAGANYAFFVPEALEVLFPTP